WRLLHLWFDRWRSSLLLGDELDGPAGRRLDHLPLGPRGGDWGAHLHRAGRRDLPYLRNRARRRAVLLGIQPKGRTGRRYPDRQSSPRGSHGGAHLVGDRRRRLSDVRRDTRRDGVLLGGCVLR